LPQLGEDVFRLAGEVGGGDHRDVLRSSVSGLMPITFAVYLSFRIARFTLSDQCCRRQSRKLRRPSGNRRSLQPSDLCASWNSRKADR
jgi:hypothetical protein